VEREDYPGNRKSAKGAGGPLWKVIADHQALLRHVSMLREVKVVGGNGTGLELLMHRLKVQLVHSFARCFGNSVSSSLTPNDLRFPC
jgi:hypothetical protein